MATVNDLLKALTGDDYSNMEKKLKQLNKTINQGSFTHERKMQKMRLQNEKVLEKERMRSMTRIERARMKLQERDPKDQRRVSGMRSGLGRVGVGAAGLAAGAGFTLSNLIYGAARIQRTATRLGVDNKQLERLEKSAQAQGQQASVGEIMSKILTKEGTTSFDQLERLSTMFREQNDGTPGSAYRINKMSERYGLNQQELELLLDLPSVKDLAKSVKTQADPQAQAKMIGRFVVALENLVTTLGNTYLSEINQGLQLGIKGLSAVSDGLIALKKAYDEMDYEKLGDIFGKAAAAAIVLHAGKNLLGGGGGGGSGPWAPGRGRGGGFSNAAGMAAGMYFGGQAAGSLANNYGEGFNPDEQFIKDVMTMMGSVLMMTPHPTARLAGIALTGMGQLDTKGVEAILELPTVQEGFENSALLGFFRSLKIEPKKLGEYDENAVRQIGRQYSPDTRGSSSNAPPQYWPTPATAPAKVEVTNHFTITGVNDIADFERKVAPIVTKLFKKELSDSTEDMNRTQ